MTLEGTALKSLALLVLCVGGGIYGWQVVIQNPTNSGLYILGGALLAFAVAIVTIMKKSLSPFTAPIYAILEGFSVGAISQLYERQFTGIVLQSLVLTGSIFAAMLLVYLFHIIKPTDNLKLAVAAATGGIALYYLVNIVANIFGKGLPLIASNSGWGIGFSVIVIIIAAFNLVVDFDFIEHGVAKRTPKYMEWYASFGLLVTMVWLYLEILRLLSKVRSR